MTDTLFYVTQDYLWIGWLFFVCVILSGLALGGYFVADAVARLWTKRPRLTRHAPSPLLEQQIRDERERLVYEVIVAGRHVPHTPGLAKEQRRQENTLTFPKGKIH